MIDPGIIPFLEFIHPAWQDEMNQNQGQDEARYLQQKYVQTRRWLMLVIYLVRRGHMGCEKESLGGDDA